MYPLPDLSLYPPRTAARISKAIDLAESGAVSPNGSGYYVRSQTTSATTYHVAVDTGCNCPDAAYNVGLMMGPDGNFRPACKHQIAVWYHIHHSLPRWPASPRARY